MQTFIACMYKRYSDYGLHRTREYRGSVVGMLVFLRGRRGFGLNQIVLFHERFKIITWLITIISLIVLWSIVNKVFV